MDILKLFSSNEREIKGFRKIVEKINALEPEIQALSDEQLRAKTDEFRQRVADGAYSGRSAGGGFRGRSRGRHQDPGHAALRRADDRWDGAAPGPDRGDEDR